MPRNLTFSLSGAQYQAAPTKIDRKKLYGWTETLALDDDGNECKLASADSSGTVIIPKGGTGLGILSPDGQWVTRSQLVALNENGDKATLIPSSFNEVITLKNKVSIEEFLDHSIAATYQMDDAPAAFIKAIGNDIYTFDYLFRDGYAGTPAFLLTAEDAAKNKNLFLMTATFNKFEMLSLEQCSIIDEEDEEETEDTDEMDFSMF